MIIVTKGGHPSQKRMDFRKSSRGWGSFSIQKIRLQNFLYIEDIFEREKKSSIFVRDGSPKIVIVVTVLILGMGI